MNLESDWQTVHRTALEQRLAGVTRLPQGIIHERPASMHRLLIRKVGSRLELVFLGGESSEVISDLEVDRPLHLFAGFTQAMMLGLLWNEEPSRVYVLGFGAGRVPMVLHHYFPEVHIESTDIDPDVVEVAREYFGIVEDERQQVIVQDGRAYLAERPADVRYDIIMVDAFRGVGSSPVQLGTLEFYRICQAHLTATGVVVVNLMQSDELFFEKVQTLAYCFNTVYAVAIPSDGTMVFFASEEAPKSPSELIERAVRIETRHGFSFPFRQHAERLRNITETPEFWSRVSESQLLSDANTDRLRRRRPLPLAGVYPPEVSRGAGGGSQLPFLQHPPAGNERIGRNDRCPCGSGKKFKHCCMRASGGR